MVIAHAAGGDSVAFLWKLPGTTARPWQDRVLHLKREGNTGAVSQDSQSPVRVAGTQE